MRERTLTDPQGSGEGKVADGARSRTLNKRAGRAEHGVGGMPPTPVMIGDKSDTEPMRNGVLAHTKSPGGSMVPRYLRTNKTHCPSFRTSGVNSKAVTSWRRDGEQVMNLQKG